MPESMPITKATLKQLKDELQKLKTEDRPQVIEEIATARAQGDLKENAEYHAAKDKQGEIESRIAYLQGRISGSEVISQDPGSADHIIFGATVKVKNLDTGKEQEYTLVSSDAVDVLEGKISSVSPIGKSLIGKKRGEKTEVQTPRGIMHLEIVDYR